LRASDGCDGLPAETGGVGRHDRWAGVEIDTRSVEGLSSFGLEAGRPEGWHHMPPTRS